MSSAPAVPAPGAFSRGLRDSLPVGLALVPIGLAFGYAAQANGIHWGLASLMSAVVYAGPSQFLAMSLLSVGASFPAIVLATWILNLRYVLYAGSLAPYLAGTSRRRLLVLSHGLADGAYAVTIAHCLRTGGRDRIESYFLASVLVSFVPWVSFSLVGAAVGDRLPELLALGFDFATPAIFIALLVPLLRTRAAGATALLAALISLATVGLEPDGVGHLAAIVVAAAVGGTVQWKRSGSSS